MGVSPWLIRFTLHAPDSAQVLLALEEVYDIVFSYEELPSGDLECALYLPPATQEEAVTRATEFSLPAYTLMPVAEESWNTPPPAAPLNIGRHPITLEPWQAFGDGSHPTTRQCLRAINDLAVRISPLQELLDLGCGSGVLAVAMAKCWPHAKILASDIDPESVSATCANRRRNHTPQLLPLRAAGFRHPALRRVAPYTVITANLLANLLLQLAPEFRRYLAPGGYIILSGMLEAQGKRVLARYRAHGFTLQRRYLQEGWLTLVFQRVL